MVFNECIADITTISKDYVIAHCISADCAMGGGVVIPIRNKFVGLKDRCISFVNSCPRDDIVGHVYRDKTDTGVVYNMFTKEKVWQNAKYGLTEDVYMANLKECLTNVCMLMELHRERLIAMPKIACGIDRCDWNKVSALIREVFSETDITIRICSLE